MKIIQQEEERIKQSKIRTRSQESNIAKPLFNLSKQSWKPNISNSKGRNAMDIFMVQVKEDQSQQTLNMNVPITLRSKLTSLSNDRLDKHQSKLQDEPSIQKPIEVKAIEVKESRIFSQHFSPNKESNNLDLQGLSISERNDSQEDRGS